jgi:queuine tRNA-ribosyltransferase
MLITWHNLTHYQDLMQSLRDAIAGQRLTAHIEAITTTYASGDIDPL